MERFPVLRWIAVLLKILAVIILILAVLGTFRILVGGPLFGGPRISFVFPVVAGFGYAIGLWAFAELISVLLAIEENTRRRPEPAQRPGDEPGR